MEDQPCTSLHNSDYVLQPNHKHEAQLLHYMEGTPASSISTTMHEYEHEHYPSVHLLPPAREKPKYRGGANHVTKSANPRPVCILWALHRLL